MKLALVYDRVNKFGGAERVLQALHQLWPQAPLFTSVYHRQKASWAQSWQVVPSKLNHLPFAAAHHEWFPLLMPYAFESLNLDDYDVIFSVSSAEAKGVITKPSQVHICYLLTPTRYLWSHAHEYVLSQPKPLRPLIRLGQTYLRQWDWLAAKRPDLLIPISAEVAKRIKKYYQRQPLPVIYPPFDPRFKPKASKVGRTSKKPHFLIVSRLVAYKNIGLVIQVFNQLPDFQLTIVGSGNYLKTLKRMVKQKNIQFVGYVSDDKLRGLYAQSDALILPQEEDFGIVSLEAQAQGLPVIAQAKGGALETIIPGQTGILYKPNTTQALTNALSEFLQKNWYDDKIIAHAETFSQARFQHQIKKLVEDVWQSHQNQ